MNNKENKVRVAIYARSAIGSDVSINEQTYKLSEYIKSIPNSIEVAHYSDVCDSGLTIKNRNDFQKMMVDAEKGLFDMIVTRDMSRFGRGTHIIIQSIEKLRELGVVVCFVDDEIRTDCFNGEFALSMLKVFYEDEKYKRQRKVKITERKMNYDTR